MIAIFLVAALASAQDAPPTREDQARQLFESGVAELHESRFADARDLLRASFTLAPRYATAFNLGVALRGTGELCEAAELFERLAAGELGEPRDTRSEVERYLREATAQAAELRIAIDGPSRARIRVDGVVVGSVERDDVFGRCTDPGRHVVEASAESYTRAERTVSLERGASQIVRLTLEPIVPLETTSSVFESPFFWVVTSALVAGGVAVGLWAILTSERSPTDSPLGVLEI
jgi:hypothetical protein